MYSKTLLAAVIVLSSAMYSQAQSSESSTETLRSKITAPRVIAGQQSTAQKAFGLATRNGFSGWPPHNNEAFARQNKIRNATKRLKQAESGSEREEVREELAELLAKDYEARMDKYAENLDRMEKQLEEMRDKLARRKRAKEDMVKLRMQVLEAEADDLGWPSNMPSNNLFGQDRFPPAKRPFSQVAPSAFPAPPAPPARVREKQ